MPYDYWIYQQTQRPPYPTFSDLTGEWPIPLWWMDQTQWYQDIEASAHEMRRQLTARRTPQPE